MEAEHGLAVVDGGGGVVDGDIVRQDKAGEVEELVQMALRWKRHHHHHHLRLLLTIAALVFMVSVISH